MALMVGSTISSKVTISATLGTTTAPGIYLSPLTITPIGAIVPLYSGYTGLSVGISNGYVLNEGGIFAGAGDPGRGGGDAVRLQAGSLTNDGTITGGMGGGAGGIGVVLAGGNLINNGTVTGGRSGVSNDSKFGPIGGAGIDFTAGRLTNNGMITGGIGGVGFYLAGTGGTGVTASGGSFANYGNVAGGPGLYGFIGDAGTGGAGVDIAAGSLTNSGTVTGGIGGHGDVGSYPVGIGPTTFYHDGKDGAAGGTGVGVASASFTNNGMIVGGTGGGGGTGHSGGAGGTGVAIVLGYLNNAGTIIGGIGGAAGTGGHFGNVGSDGAGGVGVYFHSGGTLVNAGFIGGGSGLGGIADAVWFGSGASRLILEPAAAFGGTVVASATAGNVLELAPGSNIGSISGLGDAIAGFGTIHFDPGAAWFIQGNTEGLAAGQTIDGIDPDDTIELMGVVQTSYSFNGHGLVLSGVSGSETIGIQGSFATSDFNVFSNAGNSFVEIVPPCFAAGTRISTERGDVEVEALQIGEEVEVLLGDGSAPVIWIGHRVVNCARHSQPRQVWPVRIAAGAFGPHLPCRDLFLSPDHAVFVGDVLIPAKYLVNGSTIVQVQMNEVTYYHVELPKHSVLLAEGLPVESYLDTGDRANFANGGGSVRLHPDFAGCVGDATGYAPLIVTGLKLDAARKLVDAARVG